MLPVEPDTNRHCFAPCQPGTFCKCLGQWIQATLEEAPIMSDEDRLEMEAQKPHPWQLNPWHPMERPIDKKHIGKLMEELGECSSAAARCLIQGIDEAEPVTGKINREWLEDEIADVLANAELNMDHFGLDRERIETRKVRKMEHLRAWHGMLE